MDERCELQDARYQIASNNGFGSFSVRFIKNGHVPFKARARFSSINPGRRIRIYTGTFFTSNPALGLFTSTRTLSPDSALSTCFRMSAAVFTGLRLTSLMTSPFRKPPLSALPPDRSTLLVPVSHLDPTHGASPEDNRWWELGGRRELPEARIPN